MFVKRCICLFIALVILCATAHAMPIQLTNGKVQVPATSVDNAEAVQLELESFQLVARNTDGSYLIHDGQAFFNVEAAALRKAVAIDAAVPTLGALEPLVRKAKGDDVVELQEGLKALGFLSGAADGSFGGGTEGAVKAFQESVGLEATGEADEVTRLLIASMAAETISLEGYVDPEVMYAPIMGRTNVDLQPIMDAGLLFSYDDIEGTGFITDGSAIQYDASGSTDLDKYELTVRLGFIAREADGAVEIVPAVKVRCLCVRRPVLEEVTIKAGDARGTAALEGMQVSLDGIYTVEEAVAPLNDAMVDALAGAAEAGELKLRVKGQYKTFDISADDPDTAALIGKTAQAIRG